MKGSGRRGRPPHDDVLTPSEWRVVNAVRHGMTSRTIAERQGVSIDAVKYHVANALLKLGLSNRAELRRWDGVARGTAMAGMERTADMNIELGAIGQISRHVSDVSAARRWYGEVLGLPHLYSFGDLAFFDCGGVRLFLSQGEGENDDSVLYFRVGDIHAARERLVGKGVEFVDAPHMIHRHADGMEEWMTFFKDPDGRPLALMAQVRPK